MKVVLTVMAVAVVVLLVAEMAAAVVGAEVALVVAEVEATEVAAPVAEVEKVEVSMVVPVATEVNVVAEQAMVGLRAEEQVRRTTKGTIHCSNLSAASSRIP